MASARALLERVKLNPREQRMVNILLVVLGVVFFIGLPIGLEMMLATKRSNVEEMRAALEAVQTARPQIRERQAKKDAVASRYAQKAPPLAGFLEGAAKAQKLEVSDSLDRPDVPIGKRFVERSTTVHLKKAGMYGIAKFLETIEKSGHPVLVSRFNIRKRSAEPDSYDVELGVSAYDRKEAAPAADKDKDKDKKPTEKTP
jgi:general secretion pathway protein M